MDSDDEWEEEEEPGESLENLSDEEKSEEDDYEVDNEWFVPHGHLSDEEMQNEDELGMGDANDREAQKAKLQILQQEFAQEMKKKTEKIKPRLIGCIWIEANGNQPSSCPKIIWDTMNTRAMLCTDPPILEEPEVEEPSSPSVPNAGNSERSSIKPVTVTDEMMKDLVRLLHGNNHSKNFLIKEYIAFVEKTEESVKNGECANPLKSVIREKIDSIAEWQVVDAVPPSVAQAAESTKKKKKNKKRLCWVVNKETLDKLDMPSLLLQNNWEYTLTPKLKLDKESTTTTEDKNETVEKSTTDDVSSSKADDTITDKDQVKVSKSQITKFTKVLTAEEKAKNLGKTTSSNALKNSPKDNKNLTENKAKSPTSSKEKKRVPLLMSVSRDQQISTTAKNKLISQFLRKSNKDSTDTTTSTSKTNRSSPPTVVDDDVVILD